MDKKFKLSEISFEIEGGRKLFRIQALKDFSNVKAGEYGGFVECEENLAQEGDCWLYNNATAYGGAHVCEDAKLYDRCIVSDEAIIRGAAIVKGECHVFGKSEVYENASLNGTINVYGEAKIHGGVAIVGSFVFNSNADIASQLHYFTSYPLMVTIQNEIEVDGNDDVNAIAMIFFRTSDGNISIVNTFAPDDIGSSPIEDLLEIINSDKMKDMGEGTKENIRSLCNIAKTYIRI